MNKKRLIFTLFLLSLIGLGVGVYFVKFFDCAETISCYFLSMKFYGLFYSMTAFSIVLFLLIIFPATRYYWWKKTRIYFIFALLIGISYEEPRGWNDLFFPQPETMYLWLSIGFVAISIISIIIALIVQKSRKSIPEIEASKKL